MSPFDKRGRGGVRRGIRPDVPYRWEGFDPARIVKGTFLHDHGRVEDETEKNAGKRPPQQKGKREGDFPICREYPDGIGRERLRYARFDRISTLDGVPVVSGERVESAASSGATGWAATPWGFTSTG